MHANWCKSHQITTIQTDWLFHRVASCHIWHAWSRTSPSSAFCPSRRATACSAVCCYENGTDAKLEIYPFDNSTVALVLPLSARHLLLEPAIVAEASEHIETYHIKIVFRRLLQSFTFLENRPNAKSRSMSLAERYVQIKSYRAAKTLQSSRLSNHQLLGNAYKRTTLLRCKCCLSGLIGFEWIWHDLTVFMCFILS